MSPRSSLSVCISRARGCSLRPRVPVCRCLHPRDHVPWCPVMLTMWTLPGTRESGYIHGHSHLAFRRKMKHLLKPLDMQMMFTGRTCLGSWLSNTSLRRVSCDALSCCCSAEESSRDIDNFGDCIMRGPRTPAQYIQNIIYIFKFLNFGEWFT